MIDYAKITVKAGDGGAGAGSFRKIKGKRYGKADGGDGGAGANVYLEATANLNTLEPYRYVKEYKAQNGMAGFPNLRRGAAGRDLVLKVPVGTVVTAETTDYSLQTTALPSSGQAVDSGQWTVDLTREGQKTLVARGGQGGRGNAKLRDEFGRRPRKGERGEIGETRQLKLELKLIADVGLIGLPNAGKSTLLSVLTAARPQIASYPFTTLEPNLGVLDSGLLGSWVDGPLGKRKPNNLIAQKPKSLILADIPGLIEGASRGRGLGDLFLRHIERTKILVHLIDTSTKTIEQIWQDYRIIRGELKAYSKELAKKKEIVVGTKTDLVEKQKVREFVSFFKSKRKKVLAISAKGGEGLKQLVHQVEPDLLI